MVRTSALGQKQERRDERHAPGRTHPGLGKSLAGDHPPLTFAGFCA